MNIGRHNYETYFLLYVDNELSAAERDDVEQFVAGNHDLSIELALLKQTALPSEEIICSFREDLYKKELQSGPFHQQLLLHLDNELDLVSANLLSEKISADDDLKKEWSNLEQTKLDSGEKIVFENKDLLYRREKAKVLPIYFYRVAAAVLIAGLFLFIGIEKFPGNKNHDAIVASAKKGGQSSKKMQDNLPGNSSGEKNNFAHQQQGNELTMKQAVTKNSLVPQDNIQVVPEKNVTASSSNEKTDDEDSSEHSTLNRVKNKTIVQKEINHLPEPYFENLNRYDRNKTASSSVQDNIKNQQTKIEKKEEPDKDIASASIKEATGSNEDTELTAMGSGYAKNTLLNEEISETAGNSILFLSEEKLNRSKLGGFFKKVKRVVVRNANIKTTNSIKIAGLEIATR